MDEIATPSARRRRPWVRATMALCAGALLFTACPQPDPDPTPTPTPDPGVWNELPEAPIPPRINHTATWAADRMVIWGGEDQDEGFAMTAVGAAWNPETQRWAEIPEAPISPRWNQVEAWTGEEVLLWGGSEGPDHLAECLTDGARYDPSTNEWQEMAEAPGDGRCGAAAVWSGDELLIYGGVVGGGPPGPDGYHNDGIAYDPEEDSWRTIPQAPIEPRSGSVGSWTGSEFVVFGGTGMTREDPLAQFNDGAAYDPETNQWREIAESPLPARSDPLGVWTEGELIVFGGRDVDEAPADRLTEAAAYDPGEDSWRSLSEMPAGHNLPQAVAANGVVYVVGGDADDERAPIFVAYVVEDDAWIERPDPPGGHRRHHTIVWTGSQLILWGGEPGTGAVWDPPS